MRPLQGLARALGLEPSEIRGLLLMGALVAVLLCAYTIAKVLRDALFLAEFGALYLPHAYIAVAVASVLVVAVETFLVRRFDGPGAASFHQFIAILLSVVAALAYPHARAWVTAAFYLWTGTQAMMLIPRFWTLALEMWDSRRARVVFPLLAGCGLIGAVAGGALAGWSTPLVERVGLLWTLPPLFAIGHLLTLLVGQHKARVARVDELPSVQSPWKIIQRSGYIRVLVSGFALSVVVGTLVDFQFKLHLQSVYQDSRMLTAFLGQFYVVLNTLSLLFQFGFAAWLLRRLGLGVASGLQPAAVLGLSLWVAIGPAMWIVASMRWIQGALYQTLGKSCSEIYYSAIRSAERRRIKPVIDTLVERWSDAAVGVLLLLSLHVFRLSPMVISLITAALAAIWLAVQVVQDRLYGRAFRRLLTRRRAEPDDVAEAFATPAARRALLDALKDGDHSVLALQLARHVRDPHIVQAVRDALADRRPDVVVAAITAMEALRVPDPERRIEALLTGEHEGVRRAAVSYLLARGPHALSFVRDLLAKGDPALQRYALDAMFERPVSARDAVTLEWIDARLAAGALEDLRLAARALGFAGPRQEAERRLRPLLDHENVEVRRAALLSAARRPSRSLVGLLLGQLLLAEVHHETREAVAAVGDPAVPELASLLRGGKGYRAQSLSAATLAQIGTRRARAALLQLVRSTDPQVRHLGLRALARVRAYSGEPVLPRETTHRLFLRELRDYRDHMNPALALAAHEAAPVRLLAASYRESADMALERATQALACWYDVEPLAGVLSRLRLEDRDRLTPALEYLEHVLPRKVFGPVRRLFETSATEQTDEAEDSSPNPWIEGAWRSEDGWLRACAVRAALAAGLGPRMFEGVQDPDPRVRAELEALAAAAC